jgi:hypothetical protein
MKKQILDEKVYYYEDGVKDFDLLMKTIDELDNLEKHSGTSTWFDWTASNDKDFIYGSTKTFDIDQINNMEDPYREKMSFVYKTIMDSFYDVSKDYATALGDYDEPKLFPTFNIKFIKDGIALSILLIKHLIKNFPKISSKCKNLNLKEKINFLMTINLF